MHKIRKGKNQGERYTRYKSRNKARDAIYKTYKGKREGKGSIR